MDKTEKSYLNTINYWQEIKEYSETRTRQRLDLREESPAWKPVVPMKALTERINANFGFCSLWVVRSGDEPRLLRDGGGIGDLSAKQNKTKTENLSSERDSLDCEETARTAICLEP